MVAQSARTIRSVTAISRVTVQPAPPVTSKTEELRPAISVLHQLSNDSGVEGSTTTTASSSTVYSGYEALMAHIVVALSAAVHMRAGWEITMTDVAAITCARSGFVCESMSTAAVVYTRCSTASASASSS